MRFHAFRRFREAVLQKSEVRQLLIGYWMGHENDEMSTRDAKQLLEDVDTGRNELRKSLIREFFEASVWRVCW